MVCEPKLPDGTVPATPLLATTSVAETAACAGVTPKALINNAIRVKTLNNVIFKECFISFPFFILKKNIKIFYQVVLKNNDAQKPEIYSGSSI
jgi:hypothetical protein